MENHLGNLQSYVKSSSSFNKGWDHFVSETCLTMITNFEKKTFIIHLQGSFHNITFTCFNFRTVPNLDPDPAIEWTSFPSGRYRSSLVRLNNLDADRKVAQKMAQQNRRNNLREDLVGNSL